MNIWMDAHWRIALSNFLVAEHLEHYCCSNCWHKAAIEYVSAFAENKIDVKKLRQCNKNDTCGCKVSIRLKHFLSQIGSLGLSSNGVLHGFVSIYREQRWFSQD